jgi:hypothetical protein
VKDIIEHTIVRHKRGECPSDGEVVWSGVFDIKTSNARFPAIKRLARVFASCDKHSFRIFPNGRYSVKREPKDAPFNYTPEEIAVRTIPFFSLERSDRYRRKLSAAAQRITNRCDTYRYYLALEYSERGEYHYSLSSKNLSMLDDNDRLLRLKRLASGRKSAVTRTLNSIERIKEKYSHTLFPENYESDPKYIQLIRYLPDQQSRLDEVSDMAIDDIPLFTGTLCENSVRSLEKWLSLPSEKYTNKRGA